MGIFKKKIDETLNTEQELLNTEKDSKTTEYDSDLDFDFDETNDSNNTNSTLEEDANDNLEVKKEEDIKSSDNSDETVIKNNKIKSLILYLIVDKYNPTMLEYFRNCGVNVSRIFTNINEAQDTLLMQVNPVKIVIIDTGSGRFSTMGTRKELLNLMGICDEDARISVYYTDTVIKTEVEYRDNLESRSIHWHKYRSTPDVVAHLLQNTSKENYIYDDYDKDSILATDENILRFKGLRFNEPKQLDIGESSITAHDVIIHMSNNEDTTDEIESYTIKI